MDFSPMSVDGPAFAAYVDNTYVDNAIPAISLPNPEPQPAPAHIPAISLPQPERQPSPVHILTRADMLHVGVNSRKRSWEETTPLAIFPYPSAPPYVPSEKRRLLDTSPKPPRFPIIAARQAEARKNSSLPKLSSHRYAKICGRAVDVRRVSGNAELRERLQDVPPAIELPRDSEPPRCIRSGPLTLYARLYARAHAGARALYTAVRNYLKGPDSRPQVDTEIIAVEIDDSGKKRRAVFVTPLVSGAFPKNVTRSEMITPPVEKVEIDKPTPSKPSRVSPVLRQKQFKPSTSAGQRSPTLPKPLTSVSKVIKADSPLEDDFHAISISDPAGVVERDVDDWDRIYQAKVAEEEAETQAWLVKEEADRQALLAQEEADLQAQLEAEYQAAELAAEKRNKLIRPLDPAWNEKVNQAMAVTNKSKVLATSVDAVEITREAFGKILPDPSRSDGTPSGWLNDEAVNAWFAAIVQQKNDSAGIKKGQVPAYETYNTGWYTNYKRDSSHKSIARWSRRKGIQGKKLLKAQKIFFPINTGAHWMLLIISPLDRKIEFLDSMGQSSRSWMRIAREWLLLELGDAYKAEEWTDSSAKSELQDNSFDCGMFTAMNGLASAKGREFVEVGTDMDMARRMMVAVLLNGGFKGDWRL